MKKNIAEILKYCPQGLPLWTPTYGNACLEECTDNRIIVRTNHGIFMTNAEGMLCSDGERILFPSKEQRDWDKFWPYKDGDVLYIKTKQNEYVFIYREQEDENYVGCYAKLGNWEHFISTPGEYVCHKSNMVIIRHATENEIDALHSAIEKEGKIWDPVKKELKKIEIVAAEEKKEKFDINTLKPFDKVLARDSNEALWVIELWMAYAPQYKKWKYQCLGSTYDQCIPYEGNEHLMAKADMPDDYYIIWEEEK